MMVEAFLGAETFTMNDIFLVDWEFFGGGRLIFFYRLKLFL